ncbi:zinc-binding alcohol dehydrogenase family protein [Noviherbaspirillum saxi]|uniref:Zinc-type alcohol dehydrogenase-like protein n=1 Tax=Noviherbaspirillum saxi TaxID=2320863 RepID=A0A3A3FEY3_9BURK|nr:zinc-binding alcohol dehydrogenase family protein [Noviherbaspirillum saxi]RJF91896.1 zinc-binding alcohol dehydrogenase family protein [Noviherbaspirillum saxi]
MKAIGIPAGSSGHDAAALADLELAAPVARGQDILVSVQAVSVNPIDIKMRGARPQADGRPRILGWDAAGIVIDTGPEVTLFAPGDRVYYAGSITRTGSNAELHLADQRLVARMPASLDFAQAAALPVASLAAWEALFERMHISTTGSDAGKTLLVIGGAGGVGSMAIQLASIVGRLRVIATASRPASQAWCSELGAELIIDHRTDLVPQLAGKDIPGVDYILCLSDTDRYFSTMARLIKPHGHICALVESASPLPMNELRGKSASFSWEGMFTRSLHATPDMIEQHRILERVAALVDAGRLRSTTQVCLDGMTADNLRKAHALVEDGGVIGKVVLARQACASCSTTQILEN